MVGDDFTRYVLIFSIDNISSVHTDKYKSSLLVLSERPTNDINYSIGIPEFNFSIKFTKANVKFCSILTMVIIVLCLLMEKKSITLRSIITITTISNG